MSNVSVQRNKATTPSAQELQIGGPGNDVFYVNVSNEVVQDSSSLDRDVVYASVDWVMTAGSHLEILSAVSQAATTPLQLTGNEFAQEIYGNAGANFIDGGGGADYLAGFSGNDTYIVDNAGDVIAEAAGGGRDVVYSFVDYTLTAGQEIEVLSTISQAATTPLQLIGNEFRQEMYGNEGANFIDGGAGDEDYMAGFGGNDTYIVDHGSDYIAEAAGGGRDVVYARVSYTLTPGAEVEVLSVISQGAGVVIDLTGNELVNELYGNTEANFLDGGGGADYLQGFGGNDSYVVETQGDVVVEGAGEGSHDVVYARASYALAAGVAVEVLSAQSQSATTPLQLTGNAFAQEIYGNAGANLLDGGGGGDYLAGLGGDDTYAVDSGTVIAEGVGQGRDVAYARSDYALAAGAEVEILSAASQAATTAINLTGNAFGQEIYGNAGANTLDGGGGADTLLSFEGDDILIGGAGADSMDGGDGSDIYYVDDAGDVVIEAGGPGTGVLDIVYANASYALAAAAHVELLAAADPASQAALNLIGNSFTQEIRGNAGANVITGGSGTEFIYGGGGADTLSGGGGNDRFVFDSALGGGNVDALIDFEPALDMILLDGNAGGAFSALASGQVGSNCFVVGPAALDANDYLIYNNATGALLYDADGNGAGAAVQFATIQTGLAGLNSGMFEVRGPAINHGPTMTSATIASVAENSPASTIVYQAAATDADGDRVTFHLTGTDVALLDIDAATGAVRLKSPADFEAKSSYSFSVWADDSSPTGQANGPNHKDVTLTILNVADNTPTPVIAETSAANDTLATAQTIDRNALALGNSPNLPDASLPSATIQGSIATPTDKDFFSITLKAGELLILDVDNSSGNLDTYLRLYAPNGNDEIAANDDLVTADPGSDPHPEYGHNTDSFLRFRAPTDGVYYFSIESFQDPQHPTSGSYELNVSVGPVASAAQIFEEDIQALLSGNSWNHANLTYGFPTSPSQYPAGIEETDQPGEFAPFTAAQQSATVQLLQLISNVANLSFAPNGASPGDADLRYAMTDAADVAYAYYPTNGGPGSLGGSAWFNKVDFGTPIQGNYAWMGILHETGHALGLKHGHEDPAVNAIHDTLEYTVMTYRSHVFSPVTEADGGYTNEEWGYPQSLMMLDIAALQRLYGANFSFHAEDSVYTVDTQTAALLINGAGQGTPGSQRMFLTVWDGGGTDTYDFSNLGGGITINLRPGEWSTVARGWLAGLGNGSVAAGNIANSLLFNDDPRSLIENAIGGSGNDTIIANQAKNLLNGGGGIDTYEWHAVADCGLGSQADVVEDLNLCHFNVALIDANSTTSADDAFTFIGTSAFHNVAGELRYQVEGSSVRVQGDVDGNGIADMEFIVNHTTFMSASDFTF